MEATSIDSHLVIEQLVAMRLRCLFPLHFHTWMMNDE